MSFHQLGTCPGVSGLVRMRLENIRLLKDGASFTEAQWLSGNITSPRIRVISHFYVTFSAVHAQVFAAAWRSFAFAPVCSRLGEVSPGAQPRCAGTDPMI